MFLATLLVAAGAIHLAMVPSHASASNVEGLTFAIAGSVQLLLGIVVAERPSWLVLASIAVVSVACIGAWVVSRTTGLPYGAHSGQAEAATSIDITTVVLEWATVLVVVLLVFLPDLGSSWSRGAVALASVVPVVVLVVTAAALSSPDALDHGHSDDGAAAGAAHTHAASAPGVEPSVVPVAAPAESALDAAGQRALASELDTVREVTARYPTVADAKRVGMYEAGSGARDTPVYFIAPFNQPYASDPGFDVEHPLVYLYTGRTDISRVVGVVYYEFSDRGPTGFTGPDDVWDVHTGLCSLPVPGGGSQVVSIDTDTSAADCAAMGGTYAESVQWTLHVWLAEGWENPAGVFVESNPRVSCVVEAYSRWLATARGTGQRPGAEATAVLAQELEAC